MKSNINEHIIGLNKMSITVKKESTLDVKRMFQGECGEEEGGRRSIHLAVRGIYVEDEARPLNGMGMLAACLPACSLCPEA